MSCSYCGAQYGCSCTVESCESTCPDPGSVTAGNYAGVYDNNTCEKRLASPGANAVLMAVQTGSGFRVQWSSSPCFLPTELLLTDGLAFNGILANMGTSGCMRRLNPDPAAEGWLRAFNGEWVLSALPTTNVPDPLELGNLTVTDTITAKNIQIGTGGSFCFPGIASGTVETTVGLNSDGCLVKQTGGSSSPLTVSAAMFYENSSELGTDTPNDAKTDGQSAQIGSEIYDPDSIATVVNATTVRVDVAGKYLIMWQAVSTDAHPNRLVNLNLSLDGTLSAYGAGPIRASSNSSTARAGIIQGMTLRTLAAGALITLPISVSGGDECGLQKVKLIVAKFAS